MKNFILPLLLIALAGCSQPDTLPSDSKRAEGLCQFNDGVEGFKVLSVTYVPGYRHASLKVQCRNGAAFEEISRTPR